MPGLLGHRKTFTRRFRTPIEKDGDPVRRRQLAAASARSSCAARKPRWRPNCRRSTRSCAASRSRPDQRELYETIRATMHARVTQGIATRGMAQSHVLVLDALLKLRQVCCDPRLVKLPSARLTGASSKLDDLLEMVSEMIAEGRRILLFSQFTSMLDLIKPSLVDAGISFVELRGDTADRAEPVRRFEAGEVPLFLISLKAGGRGLNLTSADTVIHYDPWWNPAVEDQASDRAHRIGQTKSVFVYKLIAADTVEERIIELQERKAELANIALGDEGASCRRWMPTTSTFCSASITPVWPRKASPRLVRHRRISCHLRHDVIDRRWNASNVAVRRDSGGNIEPDEERSRERIDGISALVNALGRALLHDNAAPYGEGRTTGGPYNLERRLNALWTERGLMCPCQ